MPKFVKKQNQELDFQAMTYEGTDHFSGMYRIAVYEKVNDNKHPDVTIRKVVDFVHSPVLPLMELLIEDFETTPEGEIVDFQRDLQAFKEVE